MGTCCDFFPTKLINYIEGWVPLKYPDINPRTLNVESFMGYLPKGEYQICYRNIKFNRKVVKEYYFTLKCTQKLQSKLAPIPWKNVDKLLRILNEHGIPHKHDFPHFALAYRWDNTFLTKSKFTFGCRTVENNECHIIQTHNKPLHFYVPKKKVHGVCPKMFKKDLQSQYRLFFLEPHSIYLVRDMTYILMTQGDTLFALDRCTMGVALKLQSEYSHILMDPCKEMPFLTATEECILRPAKKIKPFPPAAILPFSEISSNLPTKKVVYPLRKTSSPSVKRPKSSLKPAKKFRHSSPAERSLSSSDDELMSSLTNTEKLMLRPHLTFTRTSEMNKSNRSRDDELDDHLPLPLSMPTPAQESLISSDNESVPFVTDQERLTRRPYSTVINASEEVIESNSNMDDERDDPSLSPLVQNDMIETYRAENNDLSEAVQLTNPLQPTDSFDMDTFEETFVHPDVNQVSSVSDELMFPPQLTALETYEEFKVITSNSDDDDFVMYLSSLNLDERQVAAAYEALSAYFNMLYPLLPPPSQNDEIEAYRSETNDLIEVAETTNLLQPADCFYMDTSDQEAFIHPEVNRIPSVRNELTLPPQFIAVETSEEFNVSTFNMDDDDFITYLLSLDVDERHVAAEYEALSAHFNMLYPLSPPPAQNNEIEAYRSVTNDLIGIAETTNWLQPTDSFDMDMLDQEEFIHPGANWASYATNELMLPPHFTAMGTSEEIKARTSNRDDDDFVTYLLSLDLD